MIETDYVVSSGALIPLAVLDQVGMMDESLFIDYVDSEWGLRAKSRGHLSFGICAAQMVHCLGMSR